jgi:hypothetical protein
VKNTFYIIALIFFIFLTIGIGFLFYNFLIKPPDVTDFPPIGTSDELIEEYDLLVISEKTPKQILYVDYYYNPQTKKVDYGAAFYYNGEKWVSDLITENTLEFSEKESLNQFVSSVKGQIEIDNKTFTIDIPNIYTPMTIRANPEFTKFGGVTENTAMYVTMGQDNRFSNRFGRSTALLLKGYNTDSFRISHKDYGINTYWVMFVDEEGEFLHFDKTTLKKEHSKYKPHTFFGIQDPKAETVKYFEDGASVEQDENSVELQLGNGEIRNFELEEPFERFYESENYIISDGEGGTGIFLRIRN